MIINLCSTETASSTLFQLPNIYLEDSKQWEIKVVNFCFTLSSSLTKPKILRLTSNLITRSPGNTCQILSVFAVSTDVETLNYTPNHPLPYIIRFHDLETAVFRLEDISGSTLDNLLTASIQLEIRETFIYGF